MFKDDVRKYFKVTLAPELKQTNKEKMVWRPVQVYILQKKAGVE